MRTLARLFLAITVLGYGLATIKADFNKTHATNPSWTPHARFHVVWQILSYSSIGLVALYLIWVDGAAPLERLYLAAALSVAIYGAFFASVFARPIFLSCRVLLARGVNPLCRLFLCAPCTKASLLRQPGTLRSG
jgi:hypothetical protein